MGTNAGRQPFHPRFGGCSFQAVLGVLLASALWLRATAGPCAEPVTLGRENIPSILLILSNRQSERLLSLPPERRAFWLERFWRRLDPTPTTERNERREEHYRRVEVATREFSSKGQPGWDKRGEIYIRYGEPDFRLRASGSVEAGRGLVPPEETWIYEKDGLVFRFEERTLNGEYTFAFEDSDPERARYQLAGKTGTASDSVIGFRAMDRVERKLTKEELARMETDALGALMKKPSIYHHDYGAAEVPGWMDMVAFRGEDGNYVLEVSRELEVGRLAELGAIGGVLLESRLAVYDSLWEKKVLKVKDQVIRATEKGGVVVSDTFDLLPGSYWVAGCLKASKPAVVSIFEDSLSLSDWSTEEFWMSDLRLGVTVQDGGGGRFVSRPSRVFEKDETILISFEVYGSGAMDCFIRYTLSPIREKGLLYKLFGLSKGLPEVSVGYRRGGRSFRLLEELSLDTARLTEDNYELVVTVTDRTSDESISRVATIKLNH